MRTYADWLIEPAFQSIAPIGPSRGYNCQEQLAHLAAGNSMEFFAVLLSGLLAILSPINFGGEAIVAQQLKKQFVNVEDLVVRIDNAPNYRVIQGKIDKVRIAGKGLYPIADLRIDTLEVETDPIALQGLKAQLAKPLQAAVKVVLTEADLNKALQSPAVMQRIKQIGGKALGSQAADLLNQYELANPRVAFLSNQRLRVDLDLKSSSSPDQLKINIETDVTVAAGQSLQLTNTTINANDQPFYPPLTRRIVEGVNQQLNLDRLENDGITARILKLDFSQKQATIAAFIQARPESVQLLKKRLKKS
jgi:LmeA-like phospholipid-binding